MSAQEKRVDLKPLKNWVLEHLSHSSTLRNVVLIENDQMSATEFYHKLRIWVHLFNLERSQRTT